MLQVLSIILKQIKIYWSPFQFLLRLAVRMEIPGLIPEILKTGAWNFHHWRIRMRSAESLAAEAAEREIAATRLRAIEAAAYERARAVVERGERVVLHADAVALIRTLFLTTCSFLRITRTGSELYLGEQKALRPHRPIALPLAAALSALLGRAGVSTPCGPVVLGLAPGSIASGVDGFAQVGFGAKLIWLMPHEGSLSVVVRDAIEAFDRSFARSVSEAGPFVYREPADWSPSVTVRELAAPRACPHCGTMAALYRDLGEWLQCLGCARTFVAEEEDPSRQSCGRGARRGR